MQNLNLYISRCLLFIGFFATLFIKAQSNEVYFHELIINGTPFNKRVTAMHEDKQGYLWIGTNVGLFKYDGNNIIHYQHDVFDKNSIPNNSINSIIEDKDENLWIGCDSYLIFFDRKKNEFKGFYKGSRNTVLLKSTNDELWVRRRRNKLVKTYLHTIADSIKFDTSFNYDNDFNSSDYEVPVNVIIQDTYNRTWVGTQNGLLGLNDDSKYTPTNFKKSIKQLRVFGTNKFLALTQRGLYVLGYNNQNFKLEILESYLDFIENPLARANILTKNPSKHDFWIGTNYGLVKAERRNNIFTFTQYYTKKRKGDLLSNNITSMTFDKYSNLWIGTPKGVNKFIDRTSTFEYVNIKNNFSEFSDFSVQSILFESTQTLLIGSGNNGIFQYDLKHKTISKIKTGINDINDIRLNFNKDKLLIAGYNDLFESSTTSPINNILKTSKIKSYDHLITNIEVINENEIWVGLWNHGIDIINKKDRLSSFQQKIIREFKYNHTSDLHLAQNNILWIGTRGEGLLKIDLRNEKIHTYFPGQESGLSSEAILSIHEDQDHNIWIGTRGGGLNLYEEHNDRFKTFGSDNQLISKTITAIEHDNLGNLWLSTTNGIVRFNIKNQKFDAFGIEDGINENQFNFNSSSASYDHKTIFFGSQDGFYSINATNYSPVEIIPSTVITNFSTLGSSKIGTNNSKRSATNQYDIQSGIPIELPFDQNNVAFEFSSLDLTAPTKNEYAYTLEGVNNYWIYTTAANRNITYNDLTPGKYIFKVKSSNSNGIWNESPAEFPFTISPPYWRSNIAYALYFILFFTVLYISIILIRKWYRLKQNLITETISREKDNLHSQMRMIFFTDISHELRTPLTLILGTIEKVVKEKKFTLTPLTSQRIYNNTLRMHRLINQIMDIRKFDAGKFKLKISKNNIVDDISIIKNAFNDFAKIYKIKYEFISNKKSITGWYDVDLLEKILFNLISNAFKYTKENGEITIHLDLVAYNNTLINSHNLDGKHIKCSVRDNGVGIPKKDLVYIFDRYYQATKPQENQIPGTGIGMELVSKLIERHHGTITVESNENIFTEFTFYIPIFKNRYTNKERIIAGTPLKKNFIKNSEFQVIEEITSEFDKNEIKKIKTQNPKVLIVEDNYELRQMIHEELCSDYTIIEASNGHEGYQVAIEEKPELIISDILMPIQDGISMLKKIKENNELNNIPIFMLTAKNSSETKIECLRLGANDYIEKPFSLEFLKWKVKNNFSTRKELRKKYSKLITTAPVEIEIASNDDVFIKNIIKIIEDNMDNTILNVEFVASEIGMSRANLYRKVHHILNDTPVNFIKTIKLKRAAQLLKQNKIYISEIAYMTGFNNQKYFGKCFRKEYGMSPTKYIKKHMVSDTKIKISNK